jgi:hypothetical protein
MAALENRATQYSSGLTMQITPAELARARDLTYNGA